MKNEDFPKKLQKLAPPRGRGQKFYQKFIGYIKMVLLSKFGENRMKIEDFPQNAPKRPLGGAGQKFHQKLISYAKRFLLSKFGENRMKKEDFPKNVQNWPGGGAKNFQDIFFKY